MIDQQAIGQAIVEANAAEQAACEVLNQITKADTDLGQLRQSLLTAVQTFETKRQLLEATLGSVLDWKLPSEVLAAVNIPLPPVILPLVRVPEAEEPLVAPQLPSGSGKSSPKR